MENQRVKRSRVGSALFVMQRRGVCGVPHGRALANSVLVGLGVIVFAIWEMMSDREFQQWWVERSTH